MLRIMAFTLIIIMLLPACIGAAPAVQQDDPPPWAVPGRQLVKSFPNGGGFYFLPSTIKAYDTGIIVTTLTEHIKAENDTDTKYNVCTVWIGILLSQIKIVEDRDYSRSGKLLRINPLVDEWVSPIGFWDEEFIKAVFIYSAQTHMPRKIWPVTDFSWYVKAAVSPTGDAYYYRPDSFLRVSDTIKYIIFNTRTEYNQKRNSVKYLTSLVLLDPINNMYQQGPTSLFDAAGNKINSLPSEKTWTQISRDLPMGELAWQALEYCWKHNISVETSFENAIPNRQFVSSDHSGFTTYLYFNPDSIRVIDNCIWVQRIVENDLADYPYKYYTSLEVYRLSDRTARTAGVRTFDSNGKLFSEGIPYSDWESVSADGSDAALLDAVLEYCRTHNIKF